MYGGVNSCLLDDFVFVKDSNKEAIFEIIERPDIKDQREFPNQRILSTVTGLLAKWDK